MTEELNRRHNLATMPTINNNGESYIVPFDIYKEGYDAYDISNWFKGRVGDNGTPFGIRWYKHGQLMDVTGMRPFIEGQVGDYTIDDSDPDDPKINMDSEASNVHVVGEVNDCQEYGVAIYRLINQAMPQSGIFYGKIGVMGTQDDGTTVMSSVDVVFKVLAGHMSMVGARKFYVSELEKALLDFKAKIKRHDQEYADLVKQHNQEFQDQVKKLKDDTQQVIDDARNTYESETKNAHDSLDALKSQIQANRDEQENLSQHLAGTEQQIETHDIVTRPEYEKLDAKITDRLANMNLSPRYYNDEADMRAKNPNGSSDLCITADTGHKWLYNFDSKNWTDLGDFSYADIKPAYKHQLATFNPNNLIPDPDFKDPDSHWKFARDEGEPDYLLIENGYNGSTIVEMHGYGAALGQNYYSSCSSEMIKINPAEPIISMGLKADIHMQKNGCAYAMIDYFDANKAYLTTSNMVLYNNDDSLLDQLIFTNLSLPANTAYIRFNFDLNGSGTARFTRPQINYGNVLLPYAPANKTNELLITNNYPMYRWWEKGASSNTDAQKITISGSGIKVQSSDKNGWCFARSPQLNVNAKAGICFEALSDYDSDFVNGRGEISIAEYDSTGNQINNRAFAVTTKDMKVDDISLKPDTKFITVTISTTGRATLYVHKLQIYNQYFLKNEFAKIAEKDLIVKRPLRYTELYQWSSFHADNLNDGSVKNNSDGSVTLASTVSGFSWANIKAPRFLPENKVLSVKINCQSVKGQVVFNVKQFDHANKLLDSNDYKIAESQKPSEAVFEGIYLDANVYAVEVLIGTIGVANVTVDSVDIVESPSYTDNYFKLSSVDSVTASTNSADLPVFNITTQKDIDDGSTQPAEFNYDDGNHKINGYIQIGIQGNSSKNYPKKNYKIKMYSDAQYKNKLKWRPQADWDKNFKYNLKANYIDPTQARNLVNAQLFKAAIASTPLQFSEQSNLYEAQGLSQMEGFPIILNLNGNFHGLYTFNTKKDDKPFGLNNKQVGNEAIEFDQDGFQPFAKPDNQIDGKAFATAINDRPTDLLSNNFKKFANFINQSSDDDFKNRLKDYIDVKSVINCYIWGNLSQMEDWDNKSLILLTWDNGTHWYLTMYDMDATWGFFWDGTPTAEQTDGDTNNQWKNAARWSLDPNNLGPEAKGGVNFLFKRIYKTFKSEIKEQYTALRSNVWSNVRIIEAFKHFINQIPDAVYQQDQNRWNLNLANKYADFETLQKMILERCTAMDNFIENLTDPQSVSPAPTLNTQPDSGTAPQTKPAKQDTSPQAQPTEPKKDSDK